MIPNRRRRTILITGNKVDLSIDLTTTTTTTIHQLALSREKQVDRVTPFLQLKLLTPFYFRHFKSLSLICAHVMTMPINPGDAFFFGVFFFNHDTEEDKCLQQTEASFGEVGAELIIYARHQYPSKDIVIQLELGPRVNYFHANTGIKFPKFISTPNLIGLIVNYFFSVLISNKYTKCKCLRSRSKKQNTL